MGIVGCEQFAVGGKSIFDWRRSGVSFAGRTGVCSLSHRGV